MFTISHRGALSLLLGLFPSSRSFFGKRASLFGGTYEPTGWAFADGRLLSVRSYSALFAILGTTYGGDGVNNFALPNLQGTLALGYGNGPQTQNWQLGQNAGSENLTLVTANLPAHSHLIPEPSVWTCLAAGLAMTLLRRPFRRRAHC